MRPPSLAARRSDCDLAFARFVFASLTFARLVVTSPDSTSLGSTSLSLGSTSLNLALTGLAPASGLSLASHGRRLTARGQGGR